MSACRDGQDLATRRCVRRRLRRGRCGLSWEVWAGMRSAPIFDFSCAGNLTFASSELHFRYIFIPLPQSCEVP